MAEEGSGTGAGDPVVVSRPPADGKKVVNIYVKDGKLVIEYEE